MLNISAEQASQPDMPVGCLLGLGKLLRISKNRLNRGTLVRLLQGSSERVGI